MVSEPPPDPWGGISTCSATFAYRFNPDIQVYHAPAVDEARAVDAAEIARLRQENEQWSLKWAHTLDREQFRIDERQQLLDPCEPYLKDGETPALCIERNRRDIDALMSLLANEKKRATGLVDEERRRWYAQWPELKLEGLSPEVAAEHIRRPATAGAPEDARLTAIRQRVVSRLPGSNYPTAADDLAYVLGLYDALVKERR
jgi:hypothetical protein